MLQALATTDLPRQVRDYYDHNTRHFQRHGQAGLSIHGAVWGPGVATRDSAVHFVDELILAELRALPPEPKVLDLGCGVGASLLYLARRLPIIGEGVTISPLQAKHAAELFDRAGMTGLRCREGNFLALPSDLHHIDLAFSIEAFVHTPDVAGYFTEAARVIRPGGQLVICDHFLTHRASLNPSDTEQTWLREFRAGWKTGPLVTVEDAAVTAGASGFSLSRALDLTTHLELRRPRDLVVSMLVLIARQLKLRGGDYWSSLTGGNALQLALRSGALGYQYLVFKRDADRR